MTVRVRAPSPSVRSFGASPRGRSLSYWAAARADAVASRQVMSANASAPDGSLNSIQARGPFGSVAGKTSGAPHAAGAAIRRPAASCTDHSAGSDGEADGLGPKVVPHAARSRQATTVILMPSVQRTTTRGSLGEWQIRANARGHLGTAMPKRIERRAGDHRAVIGAQARR